MGQTQVILNRGLSTPSAGQNVYYVVVAANARCKIIAANIVNFLLIIKLILLLRINSTLKHLKFIKSKCGCISAIRKTIVLVRVYFLLPLFLNA